MKKITALTYVGNFGQAVRSFVIETDRKPANTPVPSDFTLKNAWLRFPGGSAVSAGITNVLETKTGYILETDGFLYAPDFSVKGPISFTKKDITEVHTEYADDFEALEEYGVRYRLYTPKVPGKRPLILFLHGGGEMGADNWTHMVGTIGAAKLRERYPACYVMAPQSPRPAVSADADKQSVLKVTPMQAMAMANERPFHYPDAFTGQNFGHELLASVEYLIRGMIAEGKVDPKRVYVTGMSMGGAGTLRAIAQAKDLFAACVPICPFIDDEIYYNLAHCDIPIWLSMPYLDHVLERPMYLAHGMIECKQNGNKNAHLTIYSPAELEAYHIGSDPGTPLTAKISQNHSAWILTYNNEYGILDWMMNQIKE